MKYFLFTIYNIFILQQEAEKAGKQDDEATKAPNEQEKITEKKPDGGEAEGDVAEPEDGSKKKKKKGAKEETTKEKGNFIWSVNCCYIYIQL